MRMQLLNFTLLLFLCGSLIAAPESMPSEQVASETIPLEQLSSEDAIKDLTQLELDELEAEIDSLSETSGMLDTLEKDADQLAEEMLSNKTKKVEKAPEKQPQKCFHKAMQDDPIHFAVCGNGQTILDKRTGLMWDRCTLGKSWNEEKQFCEGDSQQYNWQDALLTTVEASKKQHLHKADWRLPNIKELTSLVDTRCISPAIDMGSFPEKFEHNPGSNIATGKYDYWTSSVNEQYPQRAWSIDFNLGQDYQANKKLNKNIRLVRLGSGLSSYDIATDTSANLDEACVTYPAISFSHVINVPTESEINSDELVVVFSGIDVLPIEITDGEYQINNNGDWTSEKGQVRNNDKVKVRHTSATEFVADQKTTVKVGTQVAVFLSTTLQGAAEAFNDYLADESEPLAPLDDGLQDNNLMPFDGEGLEDQLTDIEINFDYKSTELSKAAQESIVNYFEQLKVKLDKVEVIKLVGHTDGIASEKYNEALSLKRALSVFNFVRLIPGLENTPIQYLGLGKSQPIADNNTEEGRAKNRRVDILVLFKE